MTNHVPTLETCQKLKEAGFPQETWHSWVAHISLEFDTLTWHLEDTRLNMEHDGKCAAPILTEILEQLQELSPGEFSFIKQSSGKWLLIHLVELKEEYYYGDNPAEAAALLWLELHG